MWLSVADVAKKEGVSVRTIQRRIKNSYYIGKVQEFTSRGRSGTTYKIFWSNNDTQIYYDNNDIITTQNEEICKTCK